MAIKPVNHDGTDGNSIFHREGSTSDGGGVYPFVPLDDNDNKNRTTQEKINDFRRSQGEGTGGKNHPDNSGEQQQTSGTVSEGQEGKPKDMGNYKEVKKWVETHYRRKFESWEGALKIARSEYAYGKDNTQYDYRIYDDMKPAYAKHLPALIEAVTQLHLRTPGGYAPDPNEIGPKEVREWETFGQKVLNEVKEKHRARANELGKTPAETDMEVDAAFGSVAMVQAKQDFGLQRGGGKSGGILGGISSGVGKVTDSIKSAFYDDEKGGFKLGGIIGAFTGMLLTKGSGGIAMVLGVILGAIAGHLVGDKLGEAGVSLTPNAPKKEEDKGPLWVRQQEQGQSQAQNQQKDTGMNTASVDVKDINIGDNKLPKLSVTEVDSNNVNKQIIGSRQQNKENNVSVGSA
ncbi:MAG: hypothetical protein R3D71_07685 [Rickettsiales bacterium]